MGKRILSFLLAFVMVVGMIPASAFGVFAAEPEPATAVEATFASSAPVLDGDLDDWYWTFPYVLSEVTGTGVSGTAYLSWNKDKVYIAVEHAGANKLQLKLGEKEWTLDLSETIASADGLVNGKTVAGVTELIVDALGAKASPSAYGDTAALMIKLLGKETANTAAIAKAAEIVFTGKETYRVAHNSSTSQNFTATADKIEFTRTASTGRQYSQLQTSMVRNTKDVYVEQTLTFKSMTGSDSAWGNVHTTNKGYSFWIVGKNIADGTNGGMGTLAKIYAEGDALKLVVRNPGTDGDEVIDLGKTWNETFHLGYLWGKDGSVTVYVDGVQKGYSSTAATFRINSLGTDCIFMNASGCDMELVVEDVTFTVERKTDKHSCTTAKVLADVDTANVTGKLPTTYAEGNFAFNLTWQSSNPAVIAADGTVTQPVGEDVTVEVSAVVGGNTLEAVSVTVPGAESVAEGTYEAFVAEDITVDGDLNEVAWRTGAQLGKGQPFDILWDGGNLYFGVVAADGDENMTVKIGDEVVATTAKAGNGFEVKVPYTTKGVTTLEDVTITVGKSAWTGAVNLVEMLRETIGWSDLTTTAAETNIASTESGDGFVANIAAATAPDNMPSYNIYRTPVDTLTGNPEEVGIVFDLDPSGMPAVASNSVDSAAWPAYSGMRLVVAKANGTALQLCIFNHSNTDTLMMASQQGKAKTRTLIDLGRSADEGKFTLKMLWRQDGSLDVYIDGEYVNSIANAQVSDANMESTNTATNNMIYFTAHRYGYSTTDHRKDYYKQSLNFTVSKLALSKPVEVVYPEADDTVTAEGTYDAFVASDITLDGNLSETAWRTGAKLGRGQPFDILFDGNNLYFGVVSDTDADTMTIEIGGEVVATANKAGNGFEAKVEYLTKNVDVIEDVTITVGKSAWTGDVTLVRQSRVNHFTAYTLNTGAAGDGSTGVTVTDSKFTFAVTPAEVGSYIQKYRANAKSSTASTISELQSYVGLNIEFDFDPTNMPVVSSTNTWGSIIPTWAGATIRVVAEDGGLIFGIMNTNDGLVFVHHQLTVLTSGNLWVVEPTAKINLGKKVGDGAFNVRLDWKEDGSLDLYVDGVKTGDTIVNATSTIELLKRGIGNGAPSTVSFNAYMHNSCAANMEFSIDNFTLSKAVKVKSVTNDDGEMGAVFTGAEPVVDSMNWNSVPVEIFANGEGSVSALVYNQKVYLLIKANGTVSATLNGETKTADADGAVVLAFDSTTISQYGQEAQLSVSLDGTPVWESQGKLTAEQMVTGGTPTVLGASAGVIKSGNVVVDSTKNSFEMLSNAGAPMYNNSYCAYWIYNKGDLANAYDTTMDTLLEQTVRIDKMPIGEKTGHFNDSVNQAWGYTIMFETPSAVTSGAYDFFSAVVYPDAEGNLHMRALNSEKKEADAIALGKKLGEEFKLGMLCGADNSLTIYVDGVVVATMSNMRVTQTGSVYGSAVMLKYMDPVTQTEGSEEASMTIKDVTVTKLGSKALPALEEEITKEIIFGSTDLNNVTMDMGLPTIFQSAYLGERTLRWTSSNSAAVEPDGTIHLDPENNGTATLSVYLDDSTTALWSVDVTVPATVITLEALLSEETVVVDGNLDEVAWLDWMQFGSRVPGNMAAAWTKGYVFFGVYTAEADTLKMTVNGKEITVDLKNTTVTGADGASAARSAKNGTTEIAIPLSAIGFNHTDYNQAMDFTAKLYKGETNSELQAVQLNLSGDVAEIQSLSSYTKSTGPWTLLGDTVTYKGKAPGVVDYIYKTDNAYLDHKQLIVVSNDFIFEALPITTGAMIKTATQADGFYYYFSDEDASSRIGTTICASIFTEDGTNLKLRIGQGQGLEGYVFDLGTTIGEQFRVTYYWYPNNTLDIYVNGARIGTVANAGYTTSYLGVDVVTYRYYSEKTTNDKVRFTITNQSLINTKYESVLDELTQNAVFGRVDLEHVQKNLPMVTTFASANFAALNLKWTSSDESVVAIDGTITRHETEAKSSTITVYFVDEEGNETKLWDVTATVDPMTVTKQPAPSIIHTAFAAPGSITIDGAVTDTETWLLNGWILNGEKQVVGYFGTQWDQEYLYVLLDTEAEEVALILGGKEIPVTKTGNITELKIPVSELLNCAKIEEYGVGMTIKVTMDGCTYSGVLNLTNVDWWASDNIYAGLPMLANNVKSVKMGTSDTPDGNQGAKQLENGWHLYDLYNENGTNPAGIRTYVLFMKLPVYENFADRTEATHVEFDFYAKALPEWEWDEAIKNEVGRAFANYGVTFSMSDKADAAKNSNVAVFGIVNTADEGLVLVVNRGTEDYEHFVLNKNVGEEFRIGMTWLTNANLVLTIDGVEITTIRDMSKFVNSVGDTSFVVNMIRNKEKPASADDDMDVYLTNIGFGKAHSTENIIRNLTFADIAGSNESENEITDNLNLIPYMTNGQLDNQYPIIWTSSNEDVIDPATGKVERPASGVKVVTLTATLNNNGVTETKEFRLTVYGLTVSNGNALVVSNDVNPFGMAAEAYVGILYTLDQTNNSIVYAFPEEAEPTQINLVTLTDLDAVSRLNRESLRLFVSDDNAVYTEIEDYKLHHDGCNWYLYDFEATARYIKVHYTHRDKDGADFLNAPGDMINVSWNESLVIPTDAAEIAVPTATLLDQAVAIELPEGIEAAGLRVALGSELLFHFVDKDGTVYVRIPNKDTGTLKLWNANAGDIELADKENVYEVTYGTRETLPASGRWILGLKAGQTFPDGSALAVDTLYQMGGKTVHVSTDGGYTWTKIGSVTHSTNLSSGGWGVDSKTGRLFHEFYFAASIKNGDSYDAFHNSDVEKSYCPTHVFYSDDGGKTWHDTEGLDKIEGDIYSNYVLSYTDFTELAGNDGNNTDPAKGGDEKGGAVDFVFPMGAQYNNNGAFCGRVAYTRDGGLSWHYSDSIITFGNESAFEGGVSEATILEREDGTLVYYARCQSSGVDNFTISYSLDHGVTWLTPGLASSVYTTNTQALMMTYDFDGFDGNRLTGEPIFMWGGNNVLGGNSYMRMPLNFAVSTNGMDTFRNIQNIFSETFMDDYTFTADHYITNPSIQQINGHDMYIAFSRLRQSDSIYMVVNNFTDWFTRTKGAYDSFENAIAWYEGWSLYKGVATTTDEKSSDGKYSMLVKENTQVTRSVPYLQNGKLSVDLYVDAASNFVLELQPAFSNVEQKCAVVSAKVNGTTMTLHDGTVLTLNSGWNTVTFDLKLTENSASIGINGGEMKEFAVNTKFNGNTFDKSGTEYELGNYITYVTILATSNVYVDEFFVESSLDAVMEATQADKTAANAVVEQIKEVLAAPTKENIAAAKQAYAALSQVRKDLVNRNVPTGTSTNANDEGALINYYKELLKAEAILGDIQINSGEGAGDVAEGVEGITPDQVQDAANDATTQEDLNNAITNVIDTDYSEHVDAAIEALKSAEKYDPQKKLDIELRPSLKIHVKEVTENAMKVDIEAVYAVFAIQDGVEEMTDAGLQPLDTTGQKITIKLPLPAGFVSSVNEKVFINHYDSEGVLKATHEGTVSGDETNGFFVTFENDLGFSEFVLYTHKSVSDKVKLDAYTLTLEDMVGLNFYMVLGDDVAEDENAYMQFSIGDRVIQVGKEQRRVVTDRTGTYYVYTCPVYAKEMNDQVTAQFFYDGGTSGLIRYSVRKYADYVLGHPDSYNPELVALMKEMLQYGAYAQMNFDHNTDNLANTGITATDVSTVDAATLRGMSYSFDGATTNVAAYSISLVLEENVTMKFFFKITGDPSAITITRDGVAQELKPVGNNLYCVEVTGIAAKELNEKITLRVVDGNETKEFSSSPISYCYIIAFIDDTASATLKDLCKSLYLYHEAAKAYFNR